MSDLSLVLENFFATASETFQDTLSSSIIAGATTVPILNATEYAEGDVVVLTVEPGTANEATFIGVKDTGNQIIECVWTEGNTAIGHDAGATVIDYDSATHFNAAMKGILQFANQDGTLKTDPVRAALGLGSESVNGWEVLPYSVQVSSGYNSGDRKVSLTIPNADATGTLYPGMKMRMARGTTAPTQCLDLELSSTQYASRASGSVTGAIGTMTDDITCEAWVKPESFGAQSAIVARRSGGSGFTLAIEADGRVTLIGFNGGVYEGGNSLATIRLAKWSHIAASIDLSGNSYVNYINGVSVTTQLNPGSGAISAFVQGGDLTIGAYTAGLTPFDGKISDVRVWNVVRTGLQIRDNMNQQLVGNETNLVGYWKLNGNLNDSTSNANHLTGQAGAVATNVDHPFKDLEYGTIVSVTYGAPNTTVVLAGGEFNNIPNMSLTAPYYSVQEAPYGFPTVIKNLYEDANGWLVQEHDGWCEAWKRGTITGGSRAAGGTWSAGGTTNLPVGAGVVGALKDISYSFYLPSNAFALGINLERAATDTSLNWTAINNAAGVVDFFTPNYSARVIY